MTAFKKRRSGRLIWIGANYPDDTSESKIKQDAYDYIRKHHDNQGYRLYGGPMKEKPREPLEVVSTRSAKGCNKEYIHAYAEQFYQ